jgi:hypothetical protein
MKLCIQNTTRRENVVRFLRISLLCLVAILPCFTWAQDAVQPLFSQSDLDQMLAPIALYPDDLLGDVLTASTYPLEVVQADRYVKQNAGLTGDALADALNTQPWDASVKALAQFPSVLAMMDDQLSWTQSLGDAFLAQPTGVMDTVQELRAKAQANGNLQSDGEQAVVVQSSGIAIQPYVADVVYVPFYDPNVVYGVWWWPAQPPVFWNPPPRYRPNAFGNIGAGSIAYGGRVTVNGATFPHFRPNWGAHTISVGGGRKGTPIGVWQHDPAHRQGVAYRTTPTANRAVAAQVVPAPAFQSQANQANQVRPVGHAQAQPVSGEAPARPAAMPAMVPAVRVEPPAQHEQGRPAQQGEPSRAAANGETNHGSEAHKPPN